MRFRGTQNDSVTTVSISSKLVALDFARCDVRDTSPQHVPSFLRGEPASERETSLETHSVRLVHIPIVCPYGYSREYFVLEQDFKAILQEVGLDPSIELFIPRETVGYFHYGCKTANSTASYYFGGSSWCAVWTIALNGSRYLTKGIIFAEGKVGVPSPAETLNGINRIISSLKAFENDSHSPLYLPFALSARFVESCEEKLYTIRSTIHDIESITGHGSVGGGTLSHGIPSNIMGFTARLGKASNVIAYMYKLMDIVDFIWEDLEMLSVCIAKHEVTDVIRASNNCILDAVGLLRQQSVHAKSQARYLEVRVRSQSSVLFSLLTHNDANVNIQAANASVQLAAAARRDGSAMKTIAVLTMAFLPATFFAAFFSIPSLSLGEQSNMFALYWACTIPVTIATFILWAGITQRAAMKRLLADFVGAVAGKKCSNPDATGTLEEAWPPSHSKGEVGIHSLNQLSVREISPKTDAPNSGH